MKLFKKLIPLATIGATAAVVAPLATSCSSSSLYTQNILDLYYGRFIRETEVISGGSMSREEALLRYTQDIEKDNKILVDDYFQNIQDILSIVTINEEKDPVKGTLSIKVVDIQPYYHRLSLHLCIHASIPSEILYGDEGKFDNLDLEVDINNFHYEMEYYKPDPNEKGYWEYAPVYVGIGYAPDIRELKEDHNWSMKAKGSFDVSMSGTRAKVNVDHSYDHKNLTQSMGIWIFNILSPFLTIYSNYLDNVINDESK